MQSSAPAVPRSMSRFNRFFCRWLASPLGFLSGNAVLVRYEGRRTGNTHCLPVNLVRQNGETFISVGRAEQKTWWHNFREPWPIELVRGPRRIHGTAVVVPGSTGRGQRIAADYLATHHGAARRAGLPRLAKGESPSPELLQEAASKMVFVVVTPDGTL